MADPQLVLPEVSREKLGRELTSWAEQEVALRERGWILLAQEELAVEVAFVARLPIGGGPPLPAVTACVRIDFVNYDLWAPSVTFIDMLTRRPAPPHVGAITFEDGAERNALVGRHPRTGLPFLCLPGVREYHEHPQHSGDDWLLHRAGGAGTLFAICNEVWLRMARNVNSIRFEAIELMPGIRQAQIVLAQSDVDAIAAQVGPQVEALRQLQPAPGA